jgi:hypothetical protein
VADIFGYHATGIDLVPALAGIATLLVFYFVVAVSRPFLPDDGGHREETLPAIS